MSYDRAHDRYSTWQVTGYSESDCWDYNARNVKLTNYEIKRAL